MKLKNWYLLQVKRQQHTRAINNLLAMQHECYSPSITVTKYKNSVAGSYIEPLFPGYIFIKLGTECNWMAISSTRGVNKIVRFGSYPIKVDNKIIDAIKERLPQYEEIVQIQNSFKKGDAIRIKGDNFMGLEGIFECEVGSFRSAILISYLEKISKLIVDNDLLEKVV